ncbi:MAG: hypothetical protein ABI718_00575 [Acidobacteriota bacterium]
MKHFLLGHMPPDYSRHGWEIDKLLIEIHWMIVILFVFWAAYIIYVLIRFRAGGHQPVSYGGMRSRWPVYLIIAVFAVELVDLFGYSIPAWTRWAQPLAGNVKPLEIQIVAEQFAWNVHYPGPDGIFGRRDVTLVSVDNPLGLDAKDPHATDDLNTLNELHLEVNRPVVIHISSKDVIHSFKLPVMRVNQDAVPGMEIPIHFTPTRTNNGEQWEIACAQLCGLGHYRMRGMLLVDTKEGLQDWLSQQQPALVAW